MFNPVPTTSGVQPLSTGLAYGHERYKARVSPTTTTYLERFEYAEVVSAPGWSCKIMGSHKDNTKNNVDPR